MYRIFAGTSAVAGLSFLLGQNFNQIFVNKSEKNEVNELRKKLEQLNLGPSRAAEILVHGAPTGGNIRSFDGFVLDYDTRRKTANWVLEHITPDRMARGKDVDRKLSKFHADESFPKMFQAQNEDYWGSGFDRGHLAAAGNHRSSQNRVDETFVLSNMSPQVGKGFNRDKWNELEMKCRKTAKKSINTFIVTGPLYLSKQFEDGKKYVKYQVIGANEVAVPTHFFKVALFETTKGRFEIESYILPNEVIPDSTELSTFYQDVEAIERSAGIRIFDKIPEKSITKRNGIKCKQNLFDLI